MLYRSGQPSAKPVGYWRFAAVCAVPMALFKPPCGFETRGLEALASAGCPWRVAMTSPSLMGLWVAVSAGLGVTIRANLGLPTDVQTIDLGLPPLGDIPTMLHRRRNLGAPNAMRFAEIREELVGASLRSHPGLELT